MDWMLTEEEIQAVVRDVDEQHQGEPFQPMEEEYKAIARAAVKKVVEYIIDTFDYNGSTTDTEVFFAELKQEVGL